MAATISGCRGYTVNCDRSFLPTKSWQNRQKDKLAVAKDWLDEGAAFVCVQHAGKGWTTNEPPAEAREAIHPHAVVCAGQDGDEVGNVVVLVNEDWNVVGVRRDPTSARILGVEISDRANNRVLVVSAYMPPGMDSSVSKRAKTHETAATTKKRKDRSEATRALGVVRDWIRGFECFFVCGDFNQDVRKPSSRVDPLTAALLNPTSPCADVFLQLPKVAPPIFDLLRKRQVPFCS